MPSMRIIWLFQVASMTCLGALQVRSAGHTNRNAANLIWVTAEEYYLVGSDNYKRKDEEVQSCRTQ